MGVHIVISGNLVKGRFQVLQDCLSLFPILRVLSNVPRENHGVNLTSVDHLDRFAQIFCRMRSALLTNVRVSDLRDHNLGAAGDGQQECRPEKTGQYLFETHLDAIEAILDRKVVLSFGAPNWRKLWRSLTSSGHEGECSMLGPLSSDIVAGSDNSWILELHGDNKMSRRGPPSQHH
jgi:hypothetical protein